jgi:hypothetical protein
LGILRITPPLFWVPNCGYEGAFFFCSSSPVKFKISCPVDSWLHLCLSENMGFVCAPQLNVSTYILTPFIHGMYIHSYFIQVQQMCFIDLCPYCWEITSWLKCIKRKHWGWICEPLMYIHTTAICIISLTCTIYECLYEWIYTDFVCVCVCVSMDMCRYVILSCICM